MSGKKIIDGLAAAILDLQAREAFMREVDERRDGRIARWSSDSRMIDILRRPAGAEDTE